MDEKKVIKVEKETPGGRLQSLKLPRDLSLGLAKPKKQYAPNLNVIRNKDKTKEFLKKNDQKRKERPQRDKYNKADNKQRYLQSTGIFSQGSGETKRLSSHGERPASVRDNSSVSNIVMPKINRNNWTINKKAEDVVLDELLNCDIDSDDEKMSFAPLMLSSEPNKVPKKELLVVKKEDGVNDSIPEPFRSDIYTEENPSLNIVKLPDSFAGKGLSDDPNVKKLFDYPLSDMLEGQIGKLIIKKSGKMEIQIGRIKYELSPENSFESKEELTSITTGESGETCIAVLGNVSSNFVMYPDYDVLLKRKS